MTNNVDAELLIREVAKRPIIWDTSNEEYMDKHKKNAMWVEVCSSLMEDFETKDEAQKKLICKYYFQCKYIIFSIVTNIIY
jgi:hypothetical protein